MGGSPSPIPPAATKTNQMTPACLRCHIIFLLFLIEICAYLPRNEKPLYGARTHARKVETQIPTSTNTESQCRTCAIRSGSLSKQSALLLSECRWSAFSGRPAHDEHSPERVRRMTIPASAWCGRF